LRIPIDYSLCCELVLVLSGDTNQWGLDHGKPQIPLH